MSKKCQSDHDYWHIKESEYIASFNKECLQTFRKIYLFIGTVLFGIPENVYGGIVTDREDKKT